jgi:hypothetical protein
MSESSMACPLFGCVHQKRADTAPFVGGLDNEFTDVGVDLAGEMAAFSHCHQADDIPADVGDVQLSIVGGGMGERRLDPSGHCPADSVGVTPVGDAGLQPSGKQNSGFPVGRIVSADADFSIRHGSMMPTPVPSNNPLRRPDLPRH